MWEARASKEVWERTLISLRTTSSTGFLLILGLPSLPFPFFLTTFRGPGAGAFRGNGLPSLVVAAVELDGSPVVWSDSSSLGFLSELAARGEEGGVCDRLEAPSAAGMRTDMRGRIVDASLVRAKERVTRRRRRETGCMGGGGRLRRRG